MSYVQTEKKLYVKFFDIFFSNLRTIVLISKNTPYISCYSVYFWFPVALNLTGDGGLWMIEI